MACTERKNVQAELTGDNGQHDTNLLWRSSSSTRAGSGATNLLDIWNESAIFWPSLSQTAKRSTLPLPPYHPLTYRGTICTKWSSNALADERVNVVCVCTHGCGCMRIRIRGNGSASSLSLDKGTNGACGCCRNLCLNITCTRIFIPPHKAPTCSLSPCHMREDLLHQWFEKRQQIHNEESLDAPANCQLFYPFAAYKGWIVTNKQDCHTSEGCWTTIKEEKKEKPQFIKAHLEASTTWPTYTHPSSQVTCVHADSELVNC